MKEGPGAVPSGKVCSATLTWSSEIEAGSGVGSGGLAGKVHQDEVVVGDQARPQRVWPAQVKRALLLPYYIAYLGQH
jgi:hypothetical protein